MSLESSSASVAANLRLVAEGRRPAFLCDDGARPPVAPPLAVLGLKDSRAAVGSRSLVYNPSLVHADYFRRLKESKLDLAEESGPGVKALGVVLGYIAPFADAKSPHHVLTLSWWAGAGDAQTLLYSERLPLQYDDAKFWAVRASLAAAFPGVAFLICRVGRDSRGEEVHTPVPPRGKPRGTTRETDAYNLRFVRAGVRPAYLVEAGLDPDTTLEPPLRELKLVNKLSPRGFSSFVYRDGAVRLEDLELSKGRAPREVAGTALGYLYPSAALLEDGYAVAFWYVDEPSLRVDLYGEKIPMDFDVKRIADRLLEFRAADPRVRVELERRAPTGDPNLPWIFERIGLPILVDAEVS